MNPGKNALLAGAAALAVSAAAGGVATAQEMEFEGVTVNILTRPGPVIAGRMAERGEEFIPHIDDDKDFMRARVQRLRHHLAHAEQPPSRLRYFISNIEVDETNKSGDAEFDVRCNLMVYQSRLERTEKIFVGRREDRLRTENGSYLIASRTVVLDQSLLPRSITIFF